MVNVYYFKTRQIKIHPRVIILVGFYFYGGLYIVSLLPFPSNERIIYVIYTRKTVKT